jgi:NAD(P)-dependent dehydrogenase (short-subunit alcohol dehydrogenase family)
MLNLESRTTAILGGTSGIGLATAEMLADRGATVVVGSRGHDHRKAAAESLPERASAIEVDATDRESLREFFDAAGPIDDLVVTVTRRGGAGPATALAEQDLLDGFAGKPVAHLQAVATALPHLAERGSVTLVGAGSAQSSLPGTSALAAINGAVEAVVPPLARELAPRRVNAVSPGVVETGWWDPMPIGDREDVFAQFAQQAPVGRNGTARDVAHAIVELIENDYLDGVVLPCDGGLRLT